ncbi:MAG: hypothetical protein CSA20_06810 [Deltaproteobacteria bacterium]|nr:MAG: hypothetical protein CSB23_04910 [Deltaproteobacteria bacterium]PIE72655.1 MAG: hypothetical protein CSA20_06810 [Deltaproteobacteria bacterium]
MGISNLDVVAQFIVRKTERRFDPLDDKCSTKDWSLKHLHLKHRRSERIHKEPGKTWNKLQPVPGRQPSSILRHGAQAVFLIVKAG